MFWYLLPGAGIEGKDADLVLALGSMVFGLQMLSKKTFCCACSEEECLPTL